MDPLIAPSSDCNAICSVAGRRGVCHQFDCADWVFTLPLFFPTSKSYSVASWGSGSACTLAGGVAPIYAAVHRCGETQARCQNIPCSLWWSSAKLMHCIMSPIFSVTLLLLFWLCCRMTLQKLSLYFARAGLRFTESPWRALFVCIHSRATKCLLLQLKGLEVNFPPFLYWIENKQTINSLHTFL